MSGLRTQNVSVTLGSTLALSRVSVAIQPGWTAIVGPNGAGKSTLLRVLAGLQAPDAGIVSLDGVALSQWARRERATRLAWLPQHATAHSELTVRELVHLGRLAHLGWYTAPTPFDETLVKKPGLCPLATLFH